jgi:hypothetical protein
MSATKKRRRWWVVEIGYETMGGEIKWGRLEPSPCFDEVTKQRGTYEALGFKARIVDYNP